MKLDSVRNLKATLTKKVFEDLSLSVQDAAKFGLPPGKIADFDPPLPTVSLGVSPAGPGNFKVAVRVQRQGMEKSPHVELIRNESNGEVDVRVVGPASAQAFSFRSRQRPLLIGVSAGHFDNLGGTLGCFVTTKGGDGSPRILSNNHILANVNRAGVGDAVIQQNKTDGGTKAADTVGGLGTFVRLRKSGGNTVDCALATLNVGIGSDHSTLTGVGVLAGLKADSIGVELVQKLGRTTGLTQGRVTAFDIDNLVVSYGADSFRFDDQLEIEGAAADPFSRGGDSGALVFTSGTLLAYGLLFAGTETGGTNGKGLSYANPLVNVLKALNVDLLR
jgi:hypothetical protein